MTSSRSRPSPGCLGCSLFTTVSKRHSLVSTDLWWNPIEKNNNVKKDGKEHSSGWLCPSSQQGNMWLVLSFPLQKKSTYHSFQNSKVTPHWRFRDQRCESDEKPHETRPSSWLPLIKKDGALPEAKHLWCQDTLWRLTSHGISDARHLPSEGPQLLVKPSQDWMRVRTSTAEGRQTSVHKQSRFAWEA